MAIKGQGYIKTAWDFEERPVASAKLNQWDDRIEAALELVFFLLSQAWGGGNGVLRGASAADLQVAAKPIPAMNVDIAPGYAFVNGYPYRLAQTLESSWCRAWSRGRPVRPPCRRIIWRWRGYTCGRA
jgi:hypothetical protein